jgi:hypothetical protein
MIMKKIMILLVAGLIVFFADVQPVQASRVNNNSVQRSSSSAIYQQLNRSMVCTLWTKAVASLVLVIGGLVYFGNCMYTLGADYGYAMGQRTC